MGNSKNDGKIGVSLGADLLARCDATIEKQTHKTGVNSSAMPLNTISLF